MRVHAPAVALLAIALAACSAERAPAADGTPPAQAPAGAMEGDPAAPPPMPDATAPEAEAPASAPGGDAGADSDAGALARFDGYGDLRFGMSVEQARQAWGGELEGVPEGDLEPGACRYLTPKWVKVPSDFAFMIEGGKFVRYDVGTDRETAPGGGKVGMDAGRIRQLYAGRVEESPHKYVEGGKYLAVADSGGGQGRLVFVTDAEGKVTSWRAGVPPQVDYVEGCS